MIIKGSEKMSGRIEHRQEVLAKLKSLMDETKYPFMKGYYDKLIYDYEHMTVNTYCRYVLAFLDEIQKSPKDITSSDVMNYLTNKKTKENKDGEIVLTSGTYQATIWTALNKFFEYMVEQMLIPSNPMNQVRRPKKKPPKQITRVFLTPIEAKLLMDKIRNSDDSNIFKTRDIFMIDLLLMTGMREEALVEIDKSDIKIHEKEIEVIEKGGKIASYVLDNTLILELNEWLKVRDKILNGKKEKAIFISNKLTRIRARSVSRILEDYSKFLDKHITPHKLRRTFATTYHTAHKDLLGTKELLNQEDFKTTELYILDDISATRTKAIKTMRKTMEEGSYNIEL